MSAARFLLALALVVGAGCSSLPPDPGPLASSSVAPDFATYKLARVGLLPFRTPGVDAGPGATLQSAFLSELAVVMPYELVPLSAADLVEVSQHDAHRRGRYDPRAVLEVARRYRLDALLLGTLTQYQPYPPQALGMEIELVAIETGSTLWSSSLQLDAADSRVQARLERWQRQHAGGGNRESVQLTLVSPDRFARFAASEVVAATLLGRSTARAGGYTPRNASAPR